MDDFVYRDRELLCESVAAGDLADRFGTPLYVYSQATLLNHYAALQSAFAPLAPLICFSVKSCQNTHLLRLLAQQGSGFDVVSGGELYRALQAGADPGTVVFAGVGKTAAEMNEGLAAGIGLFNVESESEFAQLIAVARTRGAPVDAALRVNPDVDARTHAHTTTGRKETKFGVDFDRVVALFERFRDCTPVRLCGLHMHLGSPVHALDAYSTALDRLLTLAADLSRAGFVIDTLDLGGGFGADYTGGDAPAPADYAAVLVPPLRDRGLRVILEPGRSIAANAGILLTRVLYVKHSGRKRFVIVDASMNELIRPALYGAYHFAWPVHAGARVPASRAADQPFDDLVTCDIVGPVCETTDCLARDRRLPPLESGDLLAFFTTGAYGIVMSSQYNSRPRAAEVLVTGSTARLIRRRETYADLLAPEIPDELR